MTNLEKRKITQIEISNFFQFISIFKKIKNKSLTQKEQRFSNIPVQIFKQ